MKKKDDKTNKIVSIVGSTIPSVCFYIVAIINFINDNSNTGVIYLCLGSTFLWGSVYLNKDKEKKK